MSQTPPGWYPDTQNPAQQRYWDGTQWTEHRAPAAQAAYAAAGAKPKSPWYLRWYTLVGAGVVALIVIASVAGGGGGTSPTASNTSDSKTSDSSSSGTTASKAPAKKAPAKKKQSGLDPDSSVENPIQAGKSYQLGDFKILPGWRLKNEGYGLGYSVDGLRVQNTTDSDHQFSVDIKLYKGENEVTADISCFANEAKPGNVVEVDCVPDGSGKPFTRITINNSF